MKRKIRTLALSWLPFRPALLIAVLTSLLTPSAQAQDIRIRILDGRNNGKQITKECLNIWIGEWPRGPHLVAGTNTNGFVVLHLNDNELMAETACPGWPARAARQAGVDTIAMSGDYYVACQEYGKIAADKPATLDSLKGLMPLYSIKRVLESGVVSANTCGKFRAEAKPGELIFFMRARTFWEKLAL